MDKLWPAEDQVGTIAERVGNPTGKPRWQWSCGFYPGSHPSEHARGIAETFDQARGAFEIAWRFFHASVTEPEGARTQWIAGLRMGVTTPPYARWLLKVP